MRGFIIDGGILFTNRNSSYRSTDYALGVEHHQVNHSLLLKGENGTHKNNIEVFWAHMKSSMRKNTRLIAAI